jgi:ABC-type uncharacterized transport system permease subunit
MIKSVEQILIGIGVGLFCTGLLLVILGAHFNSVNQESLDRLDTCRVYCNCSVTKDCPYTFDYNKVKTCECEK